MKRIKLLVAIYILLLSISSNTLLSEWEPIFEGYNRHFLYADKVDSNHIATIARVAWLDRYKLYVTDNGGKNWVQIFNDSILYLKPKTREAPMTPRSISFPKKDHIIIGCQDGWVLRTTDKGINWERSRLTNKNVEDPELVLIHEIFIDSTGTGFAMTGLRVYYTKDFGNNWIQRKITFPAGFEAGIFCTANSPKIDKLIVYLINNQYKVYTLITEDKGLSWQNVKLSLNGSGNGMCFIDENNGWMISYKDGYNVILRTRNGGYDWKNIYSKKRDISKAMFGIDFVDSLNGIAVGMQRNILMTTDGGYSWHNEYCTSKEDKTNFNVFDCVYLTNESALIFTDNTKIYKWTKGTSSVENPFSVREIILHPNPATDHITITLDEAYTTTPEIDIIDILGYSIKTEHNISDREITINTSLLNPGIYFLRIRSGGEAETRKFVVVR